MLVNGTMGMGLWGGLTLGSWMPWKHGVEKDVQNQNETMNMASYYKELYQLVNIAISTFEWKNLPEGVDERQMELWLLCNGYVIFFYDESLRSTFLSAITVYTLPMICMARFLNV
ncbi:MAG: hypothetical protein J6Q93_00930, partial [Prevotella sp.]|nr:hypothetical protein [Prevotella sp.]